MATNQQILDRAAYELGYLDAGGSLGATDAADALAAYNSMMHRWKQEDKDFNWFTQDTLGDTAPIPVWAEDGVISSLARRLSTVFSVAPSAQLVQDARDGERTIANRLINEKLEGTDMSHLPLGSLGSRYDIETDN